MIAAVRPRNMLASWAYLRIKRDRGVGFIAHCRERGVQSVFLDCGAYTAHMMGGEILLEDYYMGLDLLQPDVYVALDKIGDPEKSRQNLAKMLDAGYRPVPVFTKGAPWPELRELMQEFGYVAVGGFAGSGAGKREMQQQLASVFKTVGQVCDISKGEGKIHGFGISTPETMLKFPFFSTDSSGAVQTARYGQVVETKIDGALRQCHVNKQRDSMWDHPHLAGAGAGGGLAFQVRLNANAEQYEQLGLHVTKVWKARGLVWGDDGTEVLA